MSCKRKQMLPPSPRALPHSVSSKPSHHLQYFEAHCSWIELVMSNMKLETRRFLTLTSFEDLCYQAVKSEKLKGCKMGLYGDEYKGFGHPFSWFLYKGDARRLVEMEADGCQLLGSHGFKTHISVLSQSPSEAGTLPHLLFFIHVTWVTERAGGTLAFMLIMHRRLVTNGGRTLRFHLQTCLGKAFRGLLEVFFLCAQD